MMKGDMDALLEIVLVSRGMRFSLLLNVSIGGLWDALLEIFVEIGLLMPVVWF